MQGNCIKPCGLKSKSCVSGVLNTMSALVTVIAIQAEPICLDLSLWARNSRKYSSPRCALRITAHPCAAATCLFRAIEDAGCRVLHLPLQKTALKTSSLACSRRTSLRADQSDRTQDVGTGCHPPPLPVCAHNKVYLMNNDLPFSRNPLVSIG